MIAAGLEPAGVALVALGRVSPMRLIQNPSSYDVLITGNLFGDILTDEASVISGSMGLMP